MKTLKVLLGLLLLVPSSSLFAQNWLWGKQGHGDIKANDNASPVATDNNGNAYITGNYDATIIFGDDTLKGGIDNAYLTKYSSSGAVVWATQIIDHTGASFSNSVATDKSGNIYITGYFTGNAQAGTFSLTTPYTNSGQCSFVVKYNAAGTVLWAKQSQIGNINSYITSNSIAADKYGNIYITGYFSDSISFGSFTLNTPLSSTNEFLAKYDSNGNVLWAEKAQTNDYMYGLSVTTDNSGNALVCGFFEDTVYFGSTRLIGTDRPTTLLAKYSSSGAILWAKQGINLSANSYGEPNSVITDGADNIYIAGYMNDTVQFGSHILYSDSILSLFFIKYDSNGNIIWVKQSSKGWQGTSLAADASNKIYMAGITLVSSIDSLQFDSYKLYTNPLSHYASFLIRFDTNGTPVCGSILNNLGTILEGQINGVASDPNGTYIYIAGTFVDSIFCGPDTLVSLGGGANVFVGRWQTCNQENGINELRTKSETLTVFPNPFTNTTTISIIDNGKLTMNNYFEVDDLTGRDVMHCTFTGTQYELNAQDLAKGLYFIRVFDAERNVIGTSKIVVQ